MILERFYHGGDCTIGRLLFGGDQVFTMERGWLCNVPFQSCIPDGTYKLNAYSSPKYPDVWQIADVPGRTHILIHTANYAKQLAGCIAPGLAYTIRAPSEDDEACAVWSSRKACGRVFEYLAAQDAPTITIRSVTADIADCV